MINLVNHIIFMRIIVNTDDYRYFNENILFQSCNK